MYPSSEAQRQWCLAGFLGRKRKGSWMSESGEHNQLASLASSTAATWPYGLLPNSFIFLTTPLGLQIDTPIQGIISTVLFGPGALPARSSTTTSAIIISCTCCRTRVSHSLSLHTWLTHTIT